MTSVAAERSYIRGGLWLSRERYRPLDRSSEWYLALLEAAVDPQRYLCKPVTSRQTFEGRSDSVQFYLQHANAATIYPRRAERWYVQHIIERLIPRWIFCFSPTSMTSRWRCMSDAVKLS